MKSEGRNSKPERRPNAETRTPASGIACGVRIAFGFRPSDFEFPSGFGLRYSDFAA